MGARRVTAGVLLLPSPLGACAAAFGEAGLLGVVLPGPTPGQTLSALRAAVRARRPDVDPRLPEEAPRGRAAEDLARLSKHLTDGAEDLTDLSLDVRGLSPFRVRAGEAARRIPPGQLRTYGELARELGSAARAVGGAMAQNPFAVVVPCHRVIAAGGGPGGFSAPGGLAAKRALLALEGAQLPEPGARPRRALSRRDLER